MDCGNLRCNAHYSVYVATPRSHASLTWLAMFSNRGRRAYFASPEISVNTPLFCQEMAPSVFFHSPVAGLAALTLPKQSPCWHRGAATNPVKTVASCWHFPYFFTASENPSPLAGIELRSRNSEARALPLPQSLAAQKLCYSNFIGFRKSSPVKIAVKKLDKFFTITLL